LEKLVELGLIEATRNFAASASEPYRYRVSDPALRFYYSIVARYRSELELDDPMEIWRKHIVEELDAYMGLIFERVAQQAYVRMRHAWNCRSCASGAAGRDWIAIAGRPRSTSLPVGRMAQC
jgi:AAA+ ATPase superfamily predicted ATPase